MDNISGYIRQRLEELRDETYRDFHSKLMPETDPTVIIGVRMPQLRKLAKEISVMPEACRFMKQLPHRYYEENNLHGLLIEGIKDYDECMDALEHFLPYVDNWATCDMIAPKIFAKHREDLLVHIRAWLRSDLTYTVRFGTGMLMRHFLDDDFREEYLDMVSALRSDEYYVNMMTAWYFATALAKQYEAALPYIEGRKLDVWTHNKAIQKARESRRVSQEHKEYLGTLKIK